MSQVEQIQQVVPNKEVSAEIEQAEKRRHGNGPWLTAAIIVADVVGAGILGMPSAVAKLGGLLGTMVLTIMLAANVHISILLWKVRVGCPGCAKAGTYYELATGSFEKAPAWQRRAAAWLATFSQMSFLSGLLGLYLLSAGKGLGYMFYNHKICLPVWAAVGALALLPFAGTSRQMGSHGWLVWANILTLCGTIIIPLTYFLFFGTEELAMEKDSGAFLFAHEYSFTSVLSSLSTFTFAMTSQFMLTEIIAEMKDPQQLPKAYCGISAPFQLVAFLVAGLGGYCLFGENVEGMINENLPFGAAFQVAAFCLYVHMAVSYLIKGVVLCQSVHRQLDGKFADSSDRRARSWIGWNGTVLAVMAIAYFAANMVPFFGDAVDLLGASVTPISCWIMPILMFARHYHDTAPEERPKVSKFEWAIMAMELLLAFILLVFGTYTSCVQIAEDWHTLGNPFDCHCEGMWNTCECSSGHVGMGSCSTDALAR